MKESGRRRSRAYWEQLKLRWEQSGESQQTVADAAGESVHTFRYWLAKLRAEAEVTPEAESTAAPRFVEVRGVSSLQSVPACRLRLGEELELELASLPPAEWVRELLGRREC